MDTPTEAQLAAATLEKFKQMQFAGAELPTAVAIYNWLQSKTTPHVVANNDDADEA